MSANKPTSASSPRSLSVTASQRWFDVYCKLIIRRLCCTDLLSYQHQLHHHWSSFPKDQHLQRHHSKAASAARLQQASASLPTSSQRTLSTASEHELSRVRESGRQPITMHYRVMPNGTACYWSCIARIRCHRPTINPIYINSFFVECWYSYENVCRSSVDV